MNWALQVAIISCRAPNEVWNTKFVVMTNNSQMLRKGLSLVFPGDVIGSLLIHWLCDVLPANMMCRWDYATVFNAWFFWSWLGVFVILSLSVNHRHRYMPQWPTAQMRKASCTEEMRPEGMDRLKKFWTKMRMKSFHRRNSLVCPLLRAWGWVLTLILANCCLTAWAFKLYCSPEVSGALLWIIDSWIFPQIHRQLQLMRHHI
jgi:hypothetical protein